MKKLLMPQVAPSAPAVHPHVVRLAITRTRLAAALIWLLSASVTWAQTPGGEAADGVGTPAFQCDDLCHKLYGSQPDHLALCKEGCKEGERCVNRCRERFPDDTEKQARCNFRCARSR